MDFRHIMECGKGFIIDIPPQYARADQFQGTLGHKVNHSFKPNSEYVFFDSARFGVIRSVKTLKRIEKDEEMFAFYGYGPPGPKWYLELFRKHASENPSESTNSSLEKFEAAQKEIEAEESTSSIF